MTPITVAVDYDGEGDRYITLSGPEGYVCMDSAAAREAARELETLADAVPEGDADREDTVEIDRRELARLRGCAKALRHRSVGDWNPADVRAIESATEALDR